MPDININSILPNTSIQNEANKTNNLQKKLENAYGNKNDKELMDACKEFESIFMNMMLKEMRKTIPESGLIEKSTAREMFEDMYDEELTKNMSKNNQGVGLAQMLYNQMKNRL